MRISKVKRSKGGQLLRVKGEFAEDDLSCPGRGFWDVAEYVAYCHKMWSAIAG